MENHQYEEATWTCPVCGYTLFGDVPIVHVVCDNCKEEKKGAKRNAKLRSRVLG